MLRNSKAHAQPQQKTHLLPLSIDGTDGQTFDHFMMLAAYYADRIITCLGSEGLIANHAQIGVSLIFKCYSSVYHFVVSLSCHCCFFCWMQCLSTFRRYFAMLAGCLTLLWQIFLEDMIWFRYVADSIISSSLHETFQQLWMDWNNAVVLFL